MKTVRKIQNRSMRPIQTLRTTCAEKRGLRALAAGSLLSALLFLPAAARAQFSGPALGVPPQANQVPTPTTDPAILNPGARDLVIAPGDLMAVRLFGVPDYTAPVRVSVDGTIQLPLIGLVPVTGLTVNRAEDVIAQRLIDAGMYKNPQVSVQVSEAASQFATVSGELHAIVPLTGERHLLDVLAQAGGLPITASHVLTVLRPGSAAPIIIDLGTDPSRSEANNIAILPRDTIIVSRVGVVYVVGAFHTQGFIPLQQTSPLTLIQVTALSGGVGFEGDFKDLRIIRTSGAERKEVKVNIKHILAGKDPDPVLQADDIVFLPSNALKAAIKSGGIGTLSNLASLLIVALQR